MPDPVRTQPVESPVICKPYCLVRLKNGKTTVLETQGEEDDQDRARHRAAGRWVTAVNNWGRLGVWHFLVCRDP
jgi:type III restriction enzyme